MKSSASATISALILANVAAGMSLPESMDAVLGTGSFDKMAGDVYDNLTGAAPAPAPAPAALPPWAPVPPYALDVMEAAFSAVQNKANWKFPISAEILASDRDIVSESIGWYAGGGAQFEDIGNGRLRVTAPGYYNLIGS